MLSRNSKKYVNKFFTLSKEKVEAKRQNYHLTLTCHTQYTKQQQQHTHSHRMRKRFINFPLFVFGCLLYVDVRIRIYAIRINVNVSFLSLFVCAHKDYDIHTQQREIIYEMKFFLDFILSMYVNVSGRPSSVKYFNMKYELYRFFTIS